MVMSSITAKSLLHRGGKIWVSLLALSLGVALLLTLSNLRSQLMTGIQRVANQADLVIGGTAQPLHLVMYGLFQLGKPPSSINGSVFSRVSEHPEVSLAIPVAVGESHRGVPVIGTNTDFLSYFFRNSEPVEFSDGSMTEQNNQVILGANTAARLGYKLGEQLTIAAGYEPVASDEYPDAFTITGILEKTGTVLDNSMIVPLEGLWQARQSRADNPPDNWSQPETINLVLTRLHDRQALFAMEKALPTIASEKVTVAIPASELRPFYDFGNRLGTLLITMAVLTFGLGIITVFFTVSANLSERKSEIELLRMLGAHSRQIAWMGLLEPALMILASMIVGGLIYLLFLLAFPLWLPESTHYFLQQSYIPWEDLGSVMLLLAAGFLLTIYPAWKVFGLSKQC